MVRVFLACMLTLFPFSLLAVEGEVDRLPISDIGNICRAFDPHVPQNASLYELNTLAQEKFLRPAKTERMSKEAVAHYHALCASLSPQEQKAVIDAFRKLGVIEAIYPQYREPDYIHIQGSTLQNLRERIMFLASLVEEGKITLRPETKIVFLMGDRKLFDSETEEVLLNPAPFKLSADWKRPQDLPTNELDLGELAWAQLELPLALREKKPIFLKAAKKPNEIRAQTEDCVKEFLALYPIPKKASILVISSNPFVDYQKKVTELIFKKAGYAGTGLRFEAAGEAMAVGGRDPCITLGLLMDNLARTLYTEVQLEK